MTNRSSNAKKGKILNHGSALGQANETDVDNRAQEVASIEGHSRVRNEDRREAESEFEGGDVPPSIDDDVEGIGAGSRDPSEPSSNTGKQTPNRETEDEQFAAERLVAEGVNEADRDQMLAARRRKNV